MKCPEGSVVVGDHTALHQLEIWEAYHDNWCEHNPSCTIYYKESEFLEIGNWVFNRLDKISGLSFLPYDDNVYEQAPYEQITKKQYDLMKTQSVQINWDRLKEFENESNMKIVHDLACSAGVCER